MSSSNSFERLILKHLLRNEGIPIVGGAGPYIGLSVTDPGEDGTTPTEPVGNGYARVPLLDSNGQGFPAWLAATIDAADGDSIFNDNDIIWPVATGDWGVLDWWFIAAGELEIGEAIYSSGQLSTARDVKAGERLRFAAGTFAITAE